MEANGSEGKLLSLLLLFFVYHGNPINMRIVHHFNLTCLITVSLSVDDAKPAAKVKTARKPAPKVDDASDDQSVEANGSEGKLLSLLLLFFVSL